MMIMEARLRLNSIANQDGVDQFSQMNQKALSILTNAHDGLANRTAIKVDSHFIEISSHLLYSLLQIRILLVLGSTYHSSNIHDTPQDDLSRVIVEAD